MSHKEFIREIPGSSGAVLLIHGILGTPRHFDFLIPLIPENWSVYNILLDGHGGTVGDFSRTSMEKWRSQVSTQLDDILSRHDQVILVAHSMGTLFSIREAVRHPEKIRYLFMLQCPLRPRLSLRGAFNAGLLPFGIVTKGNRMCYEACSVTQSLRLWQYLGWIPRFVELFQESRRTRMILGQLDVPCRFYQSRRDEMVSMRTCRDLQKYPHLKVTILPNSGHFGYLGDDLALLKSDFVRLFEP